MQYVIKQVEHPLWKDFITWCNQISQHRWRGTDWGSYYSFAWNGQGGFKVYGNRESHGKDYQEITLEQWKELIENKTPSYEIF